MVSYHRGFLRKLENRTGTKEARERVVTCKAKAGFRQDDTRTNLYLSQTLPLADSIWHYYWFCRPCRKDREPNPADAKSRAAD